VAGRGDVRAYPSLDAPEVSLPVLCGLLLLFAPALVLTGPGQAPA
jgi:hypothetical protein